MKITSSKILLKNVSDIKIFLCIFFLCFFVTPSVFAQNFHITGRIIDIHNEPLAGATVMEVGTTNGAITDPDGHYSIRVGSENADLKFTYIGYEEQQVKINGRTIINVILKEETSLLDEVVVVGFGTQKRVNLSGSVSTVALDEKITSRALTNLSTALSGQLPGLAISQNSGMAGKNDVSILIRGMGTVNNANPLIVVDGMPDVDMNRLNLNDVESVTVLKDASSAAIYGSRAANGVILITTKSGKGQDKARFEFSGNLSFSSPTNNYEYMADYPRALTLHQVAQATGTLRQNYNFKDGTIDQWMALGMIDPVKYPNTDWWDIIMRTGVMQNYNMSASGSNDKSNFFISIGLMDEEGLQINNDYRRYNARFNFDYKLKENLKIGTRFGGNWSIYEYAGDDGFTGGGVGTDLYAAIAGVTPYDPVTGYFGGKMAYNENLLAFNPYLYFTNIHNRQNRQEINPSIYLEWFPVQGLRAKIDYTINYYNQFRLNANTPARAYDFQREMMTDRWFIVESAPIRNFTNTGYKTQLNGLLNYDKKINENHQLNALFVFSQEYWYNRSQTASRNDRLHPSLTEIDAALVSIQSTGGNSNEESMRSFVGRLNYNAYDKYFLELSARYDGSSRFIGDNQYGFFPSGSLGWRFSEEHFINKFTEGILSNGKLRISYGGLGNNSGVGRYEQQETLTTNNYVIDGQIVKGFVNKKMINRNLSWESTYVTNIGLDLGFFRNRLTAEIDYYDRLTKGMNRPSEMSIHLTGAYTAPRTNIGNLRNRGIEGNFRWQDKISDFSYFVHFNISYNNNRLESWNQYLGRGSTFIDMPYGFLYSYIDKGIAQTWEDIYRSTPQGASPGDILRLDLNGDGRIDGNDQKAFPKIDQNRPRTNFGFNLGMRWKGIDVSTLFTGATGRKDYWLNRYNYVNPGIISYAFSRWHIDKPWSQENRNGGWPRLGGSNNRVETTLWLDDLSYIRLKNIQLGYTLKNNHVLSKLGVSDIRLFVSGENLLTITGYRGLDPEKQGDANYDAYPFVKSYSFGFQIGI
ncbi:MAG: TonB-dependent receptor [Tannerella sp.]|jgi:TonB-linked SusC/RagA family outer membrane protein|nr:TonB-dependent receptor [Tannerella sp.]